MSTYAPIDAETLKLANEIVDTYHKELREVGIDICMRFAHAKRDKNGVVKGVALKLHGYPCAAIIKINKYGQRTEGLQDCTLTIDGDTWPDRPLDEKTAILRHEFTHLLVARDKDGQPKLDDDGRPKLKMRLHDIVVGGFEEIIKNCGRSAVEMQMLGDIFKKPVVQGQLHWG